MKISISLLLALCSYVNAFSGKATYYEGNPTGNACGFNGVPTTSFPYGYMAACGGNVFNDGYGCGKCYKITCLGPYSTNPQCYCSEDTPSVTISCMDQCPECEDTHYDLNQLAMERIVAPGLAGTCGVISISVDEVDCGYTDNIVLRAKTGTSRYWYGLHIDDVAGPGAVSTVRIKSSGSSTYGTTCAKSEGASFWKCDGYPLTFPLSVELTASDGQVITCTNCIEAETPSAEWDFGSNFVSSGSSSGTGSSTSSTTSTTTTTTTSSGGSNGLGKIQIIVNENAGQYWTAIQFPDGDNIEQGVTSVQYRDDSHSSWITGTAETWDNPQVIAYSFDAGGVIFEGKQDYKVFTDKGSAVTNDIFTSPPLNTQSQTAYLNLPGSAYTEEGEDNTSKFPAVAMIAIILIIGLIAAGLIYYCIKRRQAKIQVSFDSGDGKQMTAGQDEETGYDMDEIEVEANGNETTR